MGRILLGGFSHITSHRFSTSHLFSVSEQIARLPNTKDAHANRLSDALIGVADVVSAAGLASAVVVAAGLCGGCCRCGSSCLGSRRRPGALGPRPRPLASVRTKPLDEVHAAAAVAALRLIILRRAWPCGRGDAARRRAPSWREGINRGTCLKPLRDDSLQALQHKTHRLITKHTTEIND